MDNEQTGEEMNNSLYKARTRALENNLYFYEDGIPKCCATCKHWAKGITEEPCFICNNHYSAWEKP